MGKRKHRSRSRSRSRSYSRRKITDQDVVLQRLERLERALLDKSAFHHSVCASRSHVSSRTSRSSTAGRNRASRSPTRESVCSRQRIHSHRPSSRSLSVSPQRSLRLGVETNPDVGFITESLEQDPFRVLPEESPQKIEMDDDVISLHEEVLDSDLFELVGKDPEANCVKIELLPELVKRWSHLLVNGLDKTELKDLLAKYPAPQNFDILNPPVLNEEIAQIIAATSLKRDKYQGQSQDQLKCGITALGCALDILLKDKTDLGKLLLPILTDAGKVLLNLYHMLSQNRKHLIIPQLNKNIKQIAIESKPDIKLFGKDFSEKCKTVKDLEKSSKDLRPFAVKDSNKTAQFPPGKKSSGEHLNSKSLPQARRVVRNYRPNPQRKRSNHH